MSNTKHEDSPNDLEVEITDLDTSYEGSKFVNACLQAQYYLAKIPWKPTRSSSLRLLLLIIIFFVPLFIGTSYGPESVAITQHGSQPRCTHPEEVIISDGTVTTDTTVHVTIIVITQTVNSSSSVITPKNVQNGTAPWQTGKDSSGACK